MARPAKKVAKAEPGLGFTEQDILDMPHILGRALGYDKLQPIHGEWIKYIWLTDESRAIQAHRKSYKTTAIIVVGIIWYLFFKPEHRVLIARKDMDGARAILGEIRKHYNGDVLRLIYRQIYGIKEFKLADDRTDRLTLPTKTKSTKEGNIEISGVDSPKTGFHYERIHTDDIITIKDRLSRAHREATKVFVRELENIVEFNGVISHTGTPWHKDDAWTILPTPKRFPIGSIDIPDLTPERVAKTRAGLPPSLFAINYELKHVSDEGALFKDPVIADHPPKLQYRGHLDASYGGDNTTAFTTLGEHEGKLYLRGWVWRQSIEDLYDVLAMICKQNNVGTVYNETNADKGLCATQLRKRGIIVVEYSEKENKHVKISANLYRHWKQVIWAPETDTEYLSQVFEYREGQEPDDAPDSAASLVRAVKASAAVVTEEDYADNDISYIYETRRRR